MDAMEDGIDHVEETHEEQVADDKQSRAMAVGAGAGAGAAGGGAAVAVASRNRDAGSDDGSSSYNSSDDEEEEKEGNKGRFGFVGNMFGAISTAAKEMVATELLGDDFGEELVEKMEEESEDESTDDSADDVSGDGRSSSGDERKPATRGQKSSLGFQDNSSQEKRRPGESL
jgi:hypothetical protein